MKTFQEWLKQQKEAMAIVSSCKPTADYQVAGACTDLKKQKKK